MKRHVDPDRFVTNPVGYYVAGNTWLVWCSKLNLAGTLLWGRPTESDIGELISAWRLTKALAKPYDFINDFSGIASIDIVPFERILGYVQQQRQAYIEETRTSVLVRPSGFASALVSGAFRLFSSSTRWRIVETSTAGFAALGRPDVEATRAALAEIFAAEAGSDGIVSTLQSLLLRSPTLSLANAAKQLRVSERSLQRKLEEAGTSFRQLASESRVQEARRLLEGTNEKLSEIARLVGLSSAGQLNRLFRNHLGAAPSQIRKRARGEQ